MSMNPPHKCVMQMILTNIFMHFYPISVNWDIINPAYGKHWISLACADSSTDTKKIQIKSGHYWNQFSRSWINIFEEEKKREKKFPKWL